jgi:signal transduction histidine kinase
MKLRSKLTWLFLLVALMISGVALWRITDDASGAVSQQSTRRYDDELTTLLGAFDGQIKTLRDARQSLATNKALKTHLLEAFAAGQFYQNPRNTAEVQAAAKALRVQAGLSSLTIIDVTKRGKVITAPHLGEHPTGEDPGLLKRIRTGRFSPILAKRAFYDKAKGKRVSLWMVTIAEKKPRDAAHVAIEYGFLVNNALLEQMTKRLANRQNDFVLTLVKKTAKGPLILATSRSSPPPWAQHAKSLSRPFDIDGNEVADYSWQVLVNTSSVVEAKRDIEQTAILLACISALLALILGFSLARGLARPLEELADAADKVASGARDLRIADRGGHSELSQLIRAFNRMTDDLAANEDRLRETERLAAWRDIARQVAHEVKNPLSPIQLNIQYLQRLRIKDEARFAREFDELAPPILDAVAQIRNNIGTFSQFARPAPLRPRTCCLAQLVDTVLALHRESVPEVELLRVGQDDLSVTVDPDKIHQVLTNLVKNAIEAIEGKNPEPGKVQVTLTTEGEWVDMSVHDTGPGIPPEIESALFTPYQTTKAAGTGLGLAIVRRLIQEHGGTINARTSPLGGAEFHIRIPRHTRVTTQEHPDSDQASAETASKSTG